jgi:integrase
MSSNKSRPRARRSNDRVDGAGAGGDGGRPPRSLKFYTIKDVAEMLGVSGRVFSIVGTKPFQDFSRAKRQLDALSRVTGWRLHDLRRTCVSGMARLGVAPHVADKILNHQCGTISSVAAVYQRHEFLAERQQALDLWGARVGEMLNGVSRETPIDLKAA